MPDVEGPAKRTLSESNGFAPNPRAPFVELGVTSAFSFLRGASDRAPGRARRLLGQVR